MFVADGRNAVSEDFDNSPLLTGFWFNGFAGPWIWYFINKIPLLMGFLIGIIFGLLVILRSSFEMSVINSPAISSIASGRGITRAYHYTRV